MGHNLRVTGGGPTVPRVWGDDLSAARASCATLTGPAEVLPAGAVGEGQASVGSGPSILGGPAHRSVVPT